MPNAKLLIGTATCREIQIWANQKLIFQGTSPAFFFWPEEHNTIVIMLLDFVEKPFRNELVIENCIWLSRGDDLYMIKFAPRENRQYMITFEHSGKPLEGEE